MISGWSIGDIPGSSITISSDGSLGWLFRNINHENFHGHFMRVEMPQPTLKNQATRCSQVLKSILDPHEAMVIKPLWTRTKNKEKEIDFLDTWRRSRIPRICSGKMEKRIHQSPIGNSMNSEEFINQIYLQGKVWKLRKGGHTNTFKTQNISLFSLNYVTNIIYSLNYPQVARI